MAAVSHQDLIEFANHFKQPAAPGIELVDTPRYRMSMQPDYPIPGPNSASWIRCRSADADEVIAQVRAAFALRRLPLLWILDPGTQPRDFADRLAAHGAVPEPHSPELAVMVARLNRMLVGWANYFCLGRVWAANRSVDQHACFRRELGSRHQQQCHPGGPQRHQPDTSLYD